MTSEQRNEIAMEVLDEVLTEATRYAKEMHKKAEKDLDDRARYSHMAGLAYRKSRDCHHLNKDKEAEKWLKKRREMIDNMDKTDDAFKKHTESDTIYGSYPNMSKGDRKTMRKIAEGQPGRYSQYQRRHDVHEEPNFWKK